MIVLSGVSMLIDLLVSKSTPISFLPHEEYILTNIIDSINKQNNYDTKEDIELYRKLDNDDSCLAIQLTGELI